MTQRKQTVPFLAAFVFLNLIASSSVALAQADIATQDEKEFSALTDEHPFTLDPQTGKHGFWWLPSTETAPYYIRYSKDVYFKIPRNYLLRLINNKYGVVFIAEMHYPDFSGATNETLQQFDFRKWETSHDIVIVSGPFDDTGHPNKNMWSWEHLTEKHEMKYGLMKANHNKLAPGSDMYFIDDPKLGKVIIQCNAKPEFDPECTVYWNMTDDLYFAYHYHRDLLPQWRIIHEHVTDLIISSRRRD